MDDKECIHTKTCSIKDETNPNFHTHLTHNAIALILAGGRGSRLHQLTDWRAKPAVPFGGKFRIIDFTLSNCVNSGIRRIGIATQYKAQSLVRHIQYGWSFLDGRFKEFVELLPAQQMTGESWYQGTADAVFQNIDVLRRHNPNYVLVLGGDHIYKMDYSKLIADHVQKSADMTVACLTIPIEKTNEFGIMNVNSEWRITGFTEKPASKDAIPIPGNPGYALASMGIYVFNASFLFNELIRDHNEPNSSHDFGKDVIPYQVLHHRIFAHPFLDSCVNIASSGVPYWRDVGTVDAYWEANLDLTTVTPDLNLYDDDWPIWTHQEQLPPAKFILEKKNRLGQAVNSMVSGGCIISGSTVRGSLLFSNVHVHSYSIIEDSVILPNVEIGRNVHLNKVVIDKNCVIPDGLIVGLDQEKDREQFYVTNKGVTLITPDMLGQRMNFIK